MRASPSRFLLTNCVGLIPRSTTVATASRSTFEGTMRVLCSYYMRDSSCHHAHSTLKGTPTCISHSDTAYYETYVACRRNLDVFIDNCFLRSENLLYHVLCYILQNKLTDIWKPNVYTLLINSKNSWLQTSQQYVTLMQQRMDRSENANYTRNNRAPLAYDATWAIALMLNSSVEVLREWVFSDGTQRRLEDFTYADSEMTHIFLDLLSKTDFIGVSVRILLIMLGKFHE